ncbi:MAG: hypothetical protein BGO55_21990 [Sphingobacteriales bacterium 50-39]|nr:MAG: hypothetical protein BGO55_21990 [Sphingobacteriales bacterium 50-39]
MLDLHTLPCRIILIMALTCSLLFACKKSDPPVKSAVKTIESFYLKASDNPGVLLQDISGDIHNDSIYLLVPINTVLTRLVPSITFKGKSIAPGNQVQQDFSKPVKYMVTAEDGTTATYTAIVTYLSTAKRITSFLFKAADNTGLSKDVPGIIGEDTIVVFIPSAQDITHLKATITYEGKSITPPAGQPLDFTSPVAYIVQAEDGTTKKYTVIAGKNLGVFFGSSDGYLYAINGVTGNLYWKYNLGSQVTGITVSNSVVYAGNANGTLYAFDMLTGAVKWTFQKTLGTFTIPTLHDNKLYVGYATSGVVQTHSLLALDAVNGGLIWEQHIAYNNYPSTLFNPTFVDGVIYINSWSSGLFVFDAVSGALKWSYRAGLSASSPAMADGVVYIGTEVTVLTALDAATGSVKWSFSNNEANSNGSATVAGDAVYIGANTYMYAINKADGTLKWKYQARGGEYGIGDNTHSTRGHFSASVVSHGILYAGNDDNLTYAIDAGTGVLKASYPYPNILEIKNTSPAPVVANGMVYTNREDNKLYVFDAANLSLKWTFAANGLVNTNACVVDTDGNIYYTGDSGDQQ